MSSIKIIEFAEESDYVYMPTEPQSPAFAPIITIEKEKPVLAKIREEDDEEDYEEENEEAAEVLAANVTLIIASFAVAILAAMISLFGRFRGMFSQKPLSTEFISEVDRLNCLVESMEYDGAAFVSVVCPPLQPNAWNIVAIIPKPRQVQKCPGICQRVFNWVNSMVILAATFISALCSGMNSILRRVQASFTKEAPCAEFLEETARLACLLDDELYDEDSFISAVCPPFAATPWNIIAIISEPAKPKAAPSASKGLFGDIKALITKIYLAIYRIFVGIIFLSSKRSDNREFELEAARLSRLLDSMEYTGEAFESSVCPPLRTTKWNALIVIEKPQEIQSAVKEHLKDENLGFLFGILATALVVFF